jgi:macrolide transport system ATP-binding/permease protein
MVPSQLSLHCVTKRFADRVVLDRVDLTARPGERIGVIGDNGSGKSTLLRLISGELPSDAGTVNVVMPGGLSTLAQVLELPGDATVHEAIDACWSSLRALERDIRLAEAALGQASSADLPAALDDYARLLDRFEARDGYGAPARLDSALDALGVAGIDRARGWSSLSGGERSRTALAATIAANAELMLLDEPTNDLDDQAWEWLVATLGRHRGTVIAVTHDRAFLDALTDVIWEVSAAGVARHGNGYAGYLAAKSAARERQRLEHDAWRNDLARQRGLVSANAGRADAIPRKLGKAGMGTGAFRARGRDHGAMSRIRIAKERVARLLESPVAPPPEPLVFTARLARDGASASGAADAAEPSKVPILRLDGVRVAGMPVCDVQLTAGDRLLITGPNGIGKTTLLRAIEGEPAPACALVSGTVDVAGRVGHLRQYAAAASAGRTLLADYAASRRVDLESAEHDLMRLGLFHGPELHQPVSSLSYGQRRRLELALIVAHPIDLLLLDEPTNHLSPDLVEDLERAVDAFDGAVVLVTHDRRLRERFSGRLLELGAVAAW